MYPESWITNEKTQKTEEPTEEPTEEKNSEGYLPYDADLDRVVSASRRNPMKRSKFARYDRQNPVQSDYLVLGLAGAIAIGLGIWVYMQSQTSEEEEGESPSTAGGTESVQGSFTNTGGQSLPAPTVQGTLVPPTSFPTSPGAPPIVPGSGTPVIIP